MMFNEESAATSSDQEETLKCLKSPLLPAVNNHNNRQSTFSV